MESLEIRQAEGFFPREVSEMLSEIGHGWDEDSLAQELLLMESEGVFEPGSQEELYQPELAHAATPGLYFQPWTIAPQSEYAVPSLFPVKPATYGRKRAPDPAKMSISTAFKLLEENLGARLQKYGPNIITRVVLLDEAISYIQDMKGLLNQAQWGGGPQQ